ncbi:hypothetical protein QX204_01105 [Nocardia sp. PE-7]|uniref:hypothetical protein n=1 Tax=Nocardia sp. PE-7 TaxID=3058426 RepID=UPI002658DC34|nr:hypothetical protein [Nocardia sp. PE-7]WKG10138.1 hypothetical protein QX204_01105 [Nocardia sp. PE-7]
MAPEPESNLSASPEDIEAAAGYLETEVWATFHRKTIAPLDAIGQGGAAWVDDASLVFPEYVAVLTQQRATLLADMVDLANTLRRYAQEMRGADNLMGGGFDELTNGLDLPPG